MKTKFIRVFFLLVLTAFFCCACGKAEKESSEQLEGSLGDIITGIYEKADLSEDFRAGMDSFEMFELTDETEVSILGTNEIDYTEATASIPMISPNAFQFVLLRVEDDNVDTVKQQLKDNADLNKWICVSAETMLIESRGNVIFFAMGDNDTVYALNSAFQKY
ncbi:MAG: hypothetical protein K2P66_13625 [Lachnospiraceae bacterium]|nr:hypothetical protein [Lachnospiraceae bacterium]